MSPTKRPSAVAGLRRGVAPPSAGAADESIARQLGRVKRHTEQDKTARITLNLTPQMYRDLIRWTDTAAEALDVPRVTVQQALRGMIREVVTEPALSAKIIHGVRAELRQDH